MTPPYPARLLLLSVCLVSSPSWAVRPFVTDDARIIDVGQMEVETWTELNISPHGSVVAQNAMVGATLTPWFELIVGSGIGREDTGQITLANPVIQPKVLLWNAGESGLPGLALAAGLTLPVGRGALFDDAVGYYTLLLVTSRLFNDALMVHANFGATYSVPPNEAQFARPYWGLGMDLALRSQQWRLILETYSGDPFEALGPAIATQGGLRWLPSDHLNLDLTFGTQPELDAGRVETGRWEGWVQVGVRLLFDVATPVGKVSDPMGARGMFDLSK